MTISTRIPVTPALAERLHRITEVYDASPGEAQRLTLKPVFDRYRQTCAAADLTHFTFVRVPKDLARFKSSVTIAPDLYDALRARIDPYTALSKSALLECVLYQVVLQLEQEGILPQSTFQPD